MDNIKKYLLVNFTLIAGLLVVLIIILEISLGIALRSSNQAITMRTRNEQVRSMNDSELQTEKTRQEIIQLQLENENRRNFWSTLPSYATLLTAIVAVVGVFVTIWKQIIENRTQRESELREREREREQREAESRREWDAKFNSIVENLGSESEAVRISAALSLLTYLKPEYEDYHDRVFTILLVNLKISHRQKFPEFHKSLVESFERAVRVKIETARQKDEEFRLDLSSTDLYRINLSGLDLSNADLGFADLTLANLINTNLWRARGIEANLERAKLSRADLEEARFRKAIFKDANIHKAKLISARLEETDLTGVEFQQSRLQSAHLEEAKLEGARFEGADLNDTYFIGAKIEDEDTLRSITRARNWHKAHFDDVVQAQLTALAQNRQT